MTNCYQHQRLGNTTTVSASRRGWLIDHWSQWQGTTSDSLWWVPYQSAAPRGADLNADAGCAMPTPLGMYIIEVLCVPDRGARCLRRGYKVV
jgi:hypothetical protein